MDHQIFAEVLSNFGEAFGAIGVDVTLGQIRWVLPVDYPRTQPSNPITELGFPLRSFYQSLERTKILPQAPRSIVCCLPTVDRKTH